MRPEPEAEPVDALPVAPVPFPPPASLVLPDAAGLCFGAPIHEGGRIFVPVARVRADPVAGDLDATPLGVFDLGTGTARFRAIPDGAATAHTVRAAATAFAAAAGLAFGAGALRRRRPARALSRPRWPRR
jgi:hypothetical protein